ncbi:sensor histidine kinase [Flavihumibacter profundi]|uniref:sensor histidine kinase n=1 Tax=Flavihumibacter profundi TaxID=2716883 RepID=UPI001CC7C078|nr:ATP-binding protein [Flavihumibacter profundi]MBZ5858609.1 HAMP domain-containing protein [Flavihumibacter profundi]
MNIKTKLRLGLIFLFVLILLFGILSLFYINKLSHDANVILKNNHESLVYCNNMLKASEDMTRSNDALHNFEYNLALQEKNITEAGEREATYALRKAFENYKNNTIKQEDVLTIRKSIYEIEAVNQQAILRKNQVAFNTAEDAKLWLALIFTTLALIALTFVANFPSVISRPIRVLSEAIGEISRKNYSKRIHLEQKDEFGDLANTFNIMAEKLDEYENSNLARIKLEKKRIETIINQMRDGIIGLDANRNILFLNAIAEKMLGLKESSIIGKYAADIALQNDLMRTLLNSAETRELKIYAEGRESYFSKEMLEIIDGNDIVGHVIVLRNITPFHELNEAKTNFIATVSHELKTPISAIKMSTSLLNDKRVGPLNEEQQELVQSITGDAERLLKITSELLNMAQVETGQIQLKLQPTDSTQMIETAINAVQGISTQKNVSIRIIQPMHLQVMADTEKSAWVLINLLSNAIRFAPENSTVDISEETLGGYLQIAVTDRGKGIEEKYQDKIFDRYFKVPGEEKSGTGLGLAISKEFIEAQQGSIGVKSKPGEGTVFFIRLPLAG